MYPLTLDYFESIGSGGFIESTPFSISSEQSTLYTRRNHDRDCGRGHGSREGFNQSLDSGE